MAWGVKKVLLRRHRIVLWIVVVLVCVLGVSTYFQTGFTANQIKTHYLKAFEKKYWTKLDIYHAGSKAIAQEYFGRVLVTVDRLSRRPELVTAVKDNDVKLLNTVLERQRETNQGVTLLFILDSAGVMIAENSQNDSNKRNIGVSFADRDYYKVALATKLPSASKVFTASSGRQALTFCSPQIDQGTVIAVLCGGITLDDLVTRLVEAKLESDFAKFGELITDNDGNVIAENRQAPTKPQSRRDDRPIAALLNGAEDFRDEVVNDRGETSFVEASQINLGTGNSIFVVSYLDKSHLDQELALLDSALARTAFGNLIRGILLTLGACLLIAWVIRKHDEATHER